MTANSFDQSGIWELGHRENPLRMQHPEMKDTMWTVVAHHDATFILSSRFSMRDESEVAAAVLHEGIVCHGQVPDVLLIEDERLLDELRPVAEQFEFEIKVVKRLKAVQFVLKDMREWFAQEKLMEQTIEREVTPFFMDEHGANMAPEDALFDDCAVCQAQKDALLEGRTLTPAEMKEAFKQAKSQGGIVGGALFDE